MCSNICFVAARRWFHEDVEHLRWKCQYYPHMSVGTGLASKQMPSYQAVATAKYGKRVLLERIVRLVLAVKLTSPRWLAQYVAATRSLFGELPLCNDATQALQALMNRRVNTPPPLQLSDQVGSGSICSRHGCQ